MHRFTPLALLVLMNSCISTSVIKFPTFDEAVALDSPAAPAVIEEHAVDYGALPMMVQYATIHARSTEASSKRVLAGAITDKAMSMKGRPDVIVLGDTQVRNTGMVHVGYGVFSNTAATSLNGWLFRCTPSRLGFRLSKDGLVLAIDPASNARKAGLMEGDTVVSIEGHEYSLEPRAGLSQRLLRTSVGEELLTIWVRPGKGQMKGRIKTLANERQELDRIQAAAAVEAKKRTEEEAAAGW